MPFFILDNSKTIQHQFEQEVEKKQKEFTATNQTGYDFRKDALENYLAGWLVLDQVICKTDENIEHIKTELENFESIVDNLKSIFKEDYVFCKLIDEIYAILWFDLAVKAKTYHKDTNAALMFKAISLSKAKSTLLKTDINKYDLSNYMPNDKSCFICTVVYTDSNDFSKIKDFREFRDQILSMNRVGMLLISIYYKIGPTVAKFIRNKRFLNVGFRIIIDFLHKILF